MRGNRARRSGIACALALVAAACGGHSGDGAAGEGAQAGGAAGASTEAGAGAAGASVEGTAGEGASLPPGSQPTLPVVGAPSAQIHVPERGECKIDSGFPGDELCILPPEPGEGIQIHVGPTNYDDPAQVNEFVLAPGQETHEHYYLKSGNAENAYYFPRNYRMRPGSHHMIIHIVAEDHPDGWAPASSADLLFRIGSLEGAQNSVYDVPPSGVMPPENEGLGIELPARSQLRVNLHHFNSSPKQALREIWVNVWFKDPATIREASRQVFMLGGLLESILPGTTRALNYQCLLPESGGRLLTLFGHRHLHTPRFSAWLHRGNERTLVYEDYDAFEPTTLFYDSITENPAPDPQDGTAGGESGVLEYERGDWLEWECNVVNDSNATLRFSNQADAGEMCILFGTLTGTTDADCVYF